MKSLRWLLATVCALAFFTGPGYASGDDGGGGDGNHGTIVPDSIIRTDTTWVAEDSPFTIGTIQIAAGATLTIEPGAEINAGTFVVQGALSMVGTAAEPIHVSAVRGALLTRVGTEATVEIRHARITGTGQNTLISSEFAALTLTDSTLTMLGGGDLIGAWVPGSGWGRVVVERNVFTNVGRLVLGHADLSFKHNRFRGAANRSTNQIETGGYASDGLRVEGNVFEPSARPLLLGVGVVAGYALSAPGNFFGSTDLEEVGEWVVDGNDFLGRSIIDLDPLLAAPPPEVPLAVPTEPLNQGVTSTFSGGIVSWEKPVSDGGAAITHYEVSVEPVYDLEEGTIVGDGTVFRVDPEETSIELTGLDSTLYYFVSVRAWNKVGADDLDHGRHVLHPLGLPTAPPTPSTRVDSPTRSITLNWSRPNLDGGSGILSYIITASPGNHTQTVEGTRTTATFTGLTRGTNYTFTVQAVNEFGTGPASLPSAAVVMPYATPGSITNFSHEIYDGRISLTWEPPSETGGLPVTGYTVGHQGVTHTATAPRLTVSANPGTGCHFFTIRAVNATGEGDTFYSPCVDMPPLDLPQAPRSVRAATSGSGQATVTWQAPSSDGGTPITGYVVTAHPNGQTKTVRSDVTSATFTGLRNGIGHTFTVRATNKVGAGANSGLSNTVTPKAPPASPTTEPSASPTTAPSAPSTVDIYTTPGYHNVNGRKWSTTCEKYSPTVTRCTTEIWATQVSERDGQFEQANSWVFNNLTYAASPRGQWKGNPLAANAVRGGKVAWTASDGRRWRTECDTATTGRNGCRSYIQASVIESFTTATGNRGYRWVTKEIFNNMVRFS